MITHTHTYSAGISRGLTQYLTTDEVADYAAKELFAEYLPNGTTSFKDCSGEDCGTWTPDAGFDLDFWDSRIMPFNMAERLAQLEEAMRTGMITTSGMIELTSLNKVKNI